MGNICQIRKFFFSKQSNDKNNIQENSTAMSDEEIINHLAKLGSPPLPKANRTVTALGSHGVHRSRFQETFPPRQIRMSDESTQVPDLPKANSDSEDDFVMIKQA